MQSVSLFCITKSLIFDYAVLYTPYGVYKIRVYTNTVKRQTEMEYLIRKIKESENKNTTVQRIVKLIAIVKVSIMAISLLLFFFPPNRFFTLIPTQCTHFYIIKTLTETDASVISFKFRSLVLSNSFQIKLPAKQMKEYWLPS